LGIIGSVANQPKSQSKFSGFSKEIPLNMTIVHEILLDYSVDGQHPATPSQIVLETWDFPIGVSL